ncbi:MAG: rhodanese-like domain-containing protein [Betaproteobacteria bacterium]|jgi:phage shock protein E|nr:MAG: rhodanese-like domain-containing protein [Betaproteobacteria bacterium]
MKISRNIVAFSLFVFTLPCLGEPMALSKRQFLSPREAASLQQKVTYLDVRSTLEWLRGHIKGAVHIPYDEVADKVAALIPDRSTPVIAYCASGGRARSVVDAMQKLGYTVVPVVNGGYRELIANGLEKD